MDTEAYRAAITEYFQAFRTGDFSNVAFSVDIEFLSPLSGSTIKGVDEVARFLQGVCTRVSEVDILSVTVDPPTASGVWQMTTTKGRLYTLNNFFRLDDEGLVYIWPMFDPKAVMDDPTGLIAWLTGDGY